MTSDSPNNRLSRRLVLVGGAAAIGTLVAGPEIPGAVAQTATPRARRGQAIVGYSQEPTVFNPLMPGNEVDQGIWWNLFSTLWIIDPAGKPFPVLAREVPSLENGGLSTDGLSWKVKLRDDVTWHDGTPFTAEDVKYTIELIKNPNFRVPSRLGHKLVTDIVIEDAHTISWRMSEPFAPYVSMLAWMFVVPKHILGQAPDPNTASFNTAPIGTGPFKWVERVTGDHVTLTANTGYFGSGPFLERLVFKYIPDLNVMFTQFRTGEIDYIGLQGITSDHYAEAKTLKDRTIYVCPRASVENLTLNLAHPCLKDKMVRQALYYGMDKKSIIEAIYYGLPKSAESYLPEENWAFNSGLPPHEYDPDKARKILDEAGWQLGADGIRTKNGLRLEFSNSTTTGNQIREQAQQLLVQDWGKIGVSFKINNMPAAVLWDKFWAESKFDSLMTNTTYTIASDPDVTHRFGSHSIPLKAGSGSNVAQFENATVDTLLAEGIRDTTPTARKAAYVEVQSIIRDELPFLPLFQGVQIEGTKTGLMGFRNNVNVNSNTWNAAEWYWA
ncbi:MAG TPA: peptide ABC transporter substrate-binding protein [Stellaceae bacterium]|nr:peptide ABC transporter substrate-binding protein [Stellaceae bacterium]